MHKNEHNFYFFLSRKEEVQKLFTREILDNQICSRSSKNAQKREKRHLGRNQVHILEF